MSRTFTWLFGLFFLMGFCGGCGQIRSDRPVVEKVVRIGENTSRIIFQIHRVPALQQNWTGIKNDPNRHKRYLDYLQEHINDFKFHNPELEVVSCEFEMVKDEGWATGILIHHKPKTIITVPSTGLLEKEK